jgi:ACT domain-containing protein
VRSIVPMGRNTSSWEKMDGIETLDLQYSLSSSTANKSVLLLVNVRKKEKLKEIDDLLQNGSEQNDFLIIRGMGV